MKCLFPILLLFNLFACTTINNYPVNLTIDKQNIIVSDGTIIPCEINEKPIELAWDATLGGFASSSPGLIRLSPRLISYPAGIQKFVILHELGHLHHAVDEYQADCFAAMYGEEHKIMYIRDWQDVKKEMSPLRWKMLLICKGNIQESEND